MKIKYNKKLNNIYIILLILLFVFTAYIYSDNNIDNLVIQDKEKAYKDAMMILQDMPDYYTKDSFNRSIDTLKAKINTVNATQCIEILPNLINSDHIKKLDEITRHNKIIGYIYAIGKLFNPISFTIYSDSAKNLKNQNENYHLVVAMLIDGIRQTKKQDREPLLPELMSFFPFIEGGNGYFVARLSECYEEEKWVEFIGQLKKRFEDKKEILDEIEEAKQRVIRNKRSDANSVRAIYH